jgi:hypothetical protein
MEINGVSGLDVIIPYVYCTGRAFVLKAILKLLLKVVHARVHHSGKFLINSHNKYSTLGKILIITYRTESWGYPGGLTIRIGLGWSQFVHRIETNANVST